MLLISALLCLLTAVGARLRCHPETLTYRFVSDIRLWGSVEQHFRVSCNVDVDCDGASMLSTGQMPAYDYIAHMYNVTVTQGTVQPSNAAKLCAQNMSTEASCTVGKEFVTTEASQEVVNATQQFMLPFGFTQDVTGRIHSAAFVEADFENQEVMNMKKGIISSFQTRISGSTETMSTEEETDSTGSHTAYYSSRKLGTGQMVEKHYKVEYKSQLSKIRRAAVVEVKAAAVVQDGEIVDSTGEVTSKVADDPITEEAMSPDDITADIDVNELLRSKSKFDLQLSLKTERSSVRRKRMADYRRMTFLPSSLEMDSTDDTKELKYDQLRELYRQLQQVSLSEVLEQFESTGDGSKLNLIRSVLMLERDLGIANIRRVLDYFVKPLADDLVLATMNMMEQSCVEVWDKCREIIELYTIAGGSAAEMVLQSLFSTRANLTEDQQIDLTNLITFMTNPSDRFVLSLIHLLTQMPEDSDKFSSLLLTLGSLAGQPSVADSTKQIAIAIILKQLQLIQPEYCTEEASHADALEAIGNMGDVRFLDRLLEVDSACSRSKVMHVALVHAMRNMLEEPRVLSFMTETLSSFDCDVSEDMLNMLLEELQDQQLGESKTGKWPLTGFNDFDQALSWILLHSPEKLSCLRSEAIRYFKDKLSPLAQSVSDKLNRENHEQHGTRTKRNIKQHSSCSTWSDFKGRYKSVQSASMFGSDSKVFKAKKHCLAHFRVGPSKASVNVYGAVFAGFSKPAKRGKLFAKVVSNGKVFSKTYSIGSVFLYFDSKGKKGLGRVYAKFGKKTLIDQKLTAPKYTSSKKLYSSPPVNIPVGKIPLYFTKIDINLKLSAKVVLTTKLSICKKYDLCLTFTPKVIAVATASASINLEAVRGGAELHFNLNYFLVGEARARKTEKPCVALSHGRDKNTVNFDFFYQIREKVRVKVKLFPPKFKFELRWSKKKVWAPSSLKWTLVAAKKSKLFSNCRNI